MYANIYSSLQLREIFHIEFLRFFGRKAKAEIYALKGGTNLRFFFKSFRYSEDMDMDVRNMGVAVLQDIVMNIFESRQLLNNMKPFGIDRIVPPDMLKAKQTETTQRFKIHLLTSAGDDLFTKIEFSRRPFSGNAIVQAVSDKILRQYKMAPLLISHYDIGSAVAQKINALASRSVIQARDIFDIFVLCTQYEPDQKNGIGSDAAKISKARNNLFDVGFEQFRDTVVSYLSEDDQNAYDSPSVWDDIKLKVVNFIDMSRRDNV